MCTRIDALFPYTTLFRSCLSLIRSISALSSSWGGGSTFVAPNLNLVISLAPLDRVLHTSSRSESQLNPTPTYALDAADKDSRRYGYSPDRNSTRLNSIH